jgi:hypothetical protein
MIDNLQASQLPWRATAATFPEVCVLRLCGGPTIGRAGARIACISFLKPRPAQLHGESCLQPRSCWLLRAILSCRWVRPLVWGPLPGILGMPGLEDGEAPASPFDELHFPIPEALQTELDVRR